MLSRINHTTAGRLAWDGGDRGEAILKPSLAWLSDKGFRYLWTVQPCERFECFGIKESAGVPVTGGRTINETVHLSDPANPMTGLTSQFER